MRSRERKREREREREISALMGMNRKSKFSR
jgi:hypothetical protein